MLCELNKANDQYQRSEMTLDIIKKAARAMIDRKDISSYDLPDKVKHKIAARHLSAREINEKYRQSRSQNAA